MSNHDGSGTSKVTTGVYHTLRKKDGKKGSINGGSIRIGKEHALALGWDNKTVVVIEINKENQLIITPLAALTRKYCAGD